MDKKIKIVLASGSPRRIEMIRKNGIEPLIIKADIVENVPLHDGMEDVPMFLSLKKGLNVYSKVTEGNFKELDEDGAVIIAADTIVYFRDDSPHKGDAPGEIMGKPKSFEDGFAMLGKLRGKSHFVVTGIALIDVKTGLKKVFTEITTVFFKDYSDEELTAYLHTDEAYDKAGGYAIQGTFAEYVDHIEGSYNNVVGFPWERIESELDSFIEEIKGNNQTVVNK